MRLGNASCSVDGLRKGSIGHGDRGMVCRQLVLALAITGVSCSYQPVTNESRTGDQITDMMSDSTKEGIMLADYDTADNTIEVVSNGQAIRPQLEDRILKLVNRERQSAGVKPLSFSAQLAQAARTHSAAMAAEGFFEHRGAGEPALFDRVTASGMDTDHVGENIFETSEGVSRAVADECVRMWMQSDGHRMNMLSPEFDKTGIAVAISRNGENYITEDFAH